MTLLWEILCLVGEAILQFAWYRWTGWYSDDFSRSERTINKVTSQRKLAKIAQKAPHPEARRMALRRLTDPAELAYVAKKAKAPHVRQAAVERLDPRQHQALLAEIVAHDGDQNVRRAAYEKLSGQSRPPALY